MLIQDPIGCFTQIERSKAAVMAAFASKEPIWLLQCETDKMFTEVANLLGTRYFSKHRPTFQMILESVHELITEGLLHVLHGSGFLSDNSWGLESFRDGDDFYRRLLPRLEKLNTVKLVVITPTGQSVLSIRKDTLEPLGPDDEIKLRVTAKAIRSGPRTMPWNQVIWSSRVPDNWLDLESGWIDDFADRLLSDLRRADVEDC